MSKKSIRKSPITKRREIPLINKVNGVNVLKCPFCKPSHPITPFIEALCGTMVEVMAVQTVVRAKYDVNYICVKCGKGGGEMVKWQNSFIHTFDCAPGTITLPTTPEYSRFAKWVYNLGDGLLKAGLHSVFGKSVNVEEVTPQGKRTGNILGYFFYRGNKNGKPTQISSRE